MAIIKRYESPIYGNYKLALLKYGLLTGAVLCLIVLFRMLIYLPINQPITYTEDIALLICMFFFTYLYRKNLPEKKFFFKEAYMLNVGMGIVAALVYGTFIILYAKNIDVGLSERYYASQAAVYQEAGLSEGDLATKLEELKRSTTPMNLGIMSGILTAVLSLIFGMIVSIFLRTEKNIVRPKKK